MSISPTSAGATELAWQDRSVADLVAEDPRRASVFEQVGIDYCCGGAMPLTQACAEHGLELATVQGMLDEVATDGVEQRNWNDATIQELVENIIEQHHSYIRTSLPRLEELAHKVARVHGDRDPRLRDAEPVVVELVAEMGAHTDEEEQEVFPICIDVAEGRFDVADADKLSAMLGGLVDDHDEAAAHIARLRELTDDFTPPEHACTTWRTFLDTLDRFEQDIHRHIHKENHVMFPKVLELLQAARSNA
jgi:regulator of cell morphogenesis and NO signaling